MATALGDFLRQLREQHGLTQEEASARSGVAQTTISALERGTSTRTSDANMAKLAAVYAVPRRVLYARAGLIEDEAEALQQPPSVDDPIEVMVERVRRDPGLMRALANLQRDADKDVFEDVLLAVADAWLANLRMGLRVAKPSLHPAPDLADASQSER